MSKFEFNPANFFEVLKRKYTNLRFLCIYTIYTSMRCIKTHINVRERFHLSEIHPHHCQAPPCAPLYALPYKIVQAEYIIFEISPRY